jgi:hypothetical protein
MWLVILFALPLIFVNIQQYGALWASYGSMLAGDHDASYGYSVMGCLHTWFGLDVNKNAVVGVGALLFMLPFARVRHYAHTPFRLLMLASALIWTVIFNHKAESPTFVIAMAGIALWFMTMPKTPVNIALFVLAILFVTLSPTDVFPRVVREEFVKPYCLKAAPCIFIWLKILYDMLNYPKLRVAKGDNISVAN